MKNCTRIRQTHQWVDIPVMALHTLTPLAFTSQKRSFVFEVLLVTFLLASSFSNLLFSCLAVLVLLGRTTSSLSVMRAFCKKVGPGRHWGIFSRSKSGMASYRCHALMAALCSHHSTGAPHTVSLSVHLTFSTTDQLSVHQLLLMSDARSLQLFLGHQQQLVLSLSLSLLCTQ